MWALKRGDRGQMILIAGLLLAALFVGLALVVNSAIFTENLSTREVEGSAQALADDPPTTERLTRSMREANYQSDTASYGERRSTIRQNVSTWNQHQVASSVQNGRLASSEVAAMQNGTRVSQDEYGKFVPADENLVDTLLDMTLDPLGLTDRTSWLVAPGVHTRAFEVTAERTSLKEVNQVDLLDLVQYILNGNDPFGVVFDEVTGSGEHRSVYLVQVDDGSGENDVAAVITAENSTSETIVGTCQIQSQNATIDFGSNELVGDSTSEPCPELSFTDSLARHDTYFVGSDNINGKYQFIVDKNESTLHNEINEEYDNILSSLLNTFDCVLNPLDPLCFFEDNDPYVFEDHPSDGVPYTTTAVYDTSVELTYMTSRMRYTRNVTVAPDT